MCSPFASSCIAPRVLRGFQSSCFPCASRHTGHCVPHGFPVGSLLCSPCIYRGLSPALPRLLYRAFHVRSSYVLLALRNMIMCFLWILSYVSRAITRAYSVCSIVYVLVNSFICSPAPSEYCLRCLCLLPCVPRLFHRFPLGYFLQFPCIRYEFADAFGRPFTAWLPWAIPLKFSRAFACVPRASPVCFP